VFEFDFVLELEFEFEFDVDLERFEFEFDVDLERFEFEFDVDLERFEFEFDVDLERFEFEIELKSFVKGNGDILLFIWVKVDLSVLLEDDLFNVISFVLWLLENFIFILDIECLFPDWFILITGEDDIGESVAIFFKFFFLL